MSAIILGIVEGLTEFLPISSTGHLILASDFLRLNQSNFIKNFEIVIQLGAILAVLFIYWSVLKNNFNLIKKVIFGFLPTAAVGLVFYDIIKKYFFSESVVVWALFIGGVVLIIFELLHKENLDGGELENISYKQAFKIGLFQSLAIVPGVSRSAATIIGGMLVDVKRKAIVEFSFLLAVPTIAAASGLDFLKNLNQFSFNQLHLLLVGFVVSFLVAILSIKFLIKFVKQHNFSSFGIYRIVLAAILLLFILK